MSEKRLLDAEHVARAIFLPAMLDSKGNVSLAAFTLRHNEGYSSVARMSVEDWLDDIKKIPETPTLSQLAGKSYITLDNIFGGGNKGVVSGSATVNIQDTVE